MPKRDAPLSNARGEKQNKSQEDEKRLPRTPTTCCGGCVGLARLVMSKENGKRVCGCCRRRKHLGPSRSLPGSTTARDRSGEDRVSPSVCSSHIKSSSSALFVSSSSSPRSGQPTTRRLEVTTTTAPRAESEQRPRASDPSVAGARAELTGSSSTTDGSSPRTGDGGVVLCKRRLGTSLSTLLCPRRAAREEHGAEVACRQVGGHAKGSGVEAEGHHLGGGVEKCGAHVGWC